MTARVLLTAIALSALCGTSIAADTAAPGESEWMRQAQDKLQATYKSLQFDKIAAADIPGLIEIYTGGKILYYSPEKELLVIGEVYASNGVSLTEQKVSAFAAQKAGSIDRSVALTVGEGTREVVAFVDPDCGYCRQANAWFQAQNFPDVRELIYFMPVKGRAQAEARALAAVCAPPAERKAALTRAFDSSTPVDLTKSERCPDGIKQLAAHADIARAVGVYATPFFIIDGEVIAGFDKERLTQLLTSPAPAATRTTQGAR